MADLRVGAVEPVRKPTTVYDLLKNPPGSHSGEIAARYAIIDHFTSKTAKLMAEPKTKEKFKLLVYKGLSPDSFLLHIETPSETSRIAWDTIVELSFAGTYAINQAIVRVISNSPAFVFTYAYVAKKYNILLTPFAKILPPECYASAPDKRNPSQSYGFEKHVTIALMYMLTKVKKRCDLESILLSGEFSVTQDLTYDYKMNEYRNSKKIADRENLLLKKSKQIATNTDILLGTNRYKKRIKSEANLRKAARSNASKARKHGRNIKTVATIRSSANIKSTKQK